MTEVIGTGEDGMSEVSQRRAQTHPKGDSG